jgi:dihydropteroate synthase
MGVLNVTPDSFSDGGRHSTSADAVAHGLQLVADGADWVDVGGESTRPGANRVPAAEERRRVLPVVRALSAAGVPVSIDTMRAEVAEAALDAGAVLVNDVSGGVADPRVLAVVAAARVPYVLMHWRGPSVDMQSRASYDDVVADVRRELAARMDSVVAAGVDPDQVVLDPGLGFAKTAEHNWSLLSDLPALTSLGRPLLIGASRKGFLGQLLATAEQPRSFDGRDVATAAITALVARESIWCVRVHDARSSRDAAEVASALVHHPAHERART